MSATPSRIAHQARDIADVLDAIVRRATLAHTQGRPPSRKPDHQPRAKGRTDPTGETAVQIAEVLDQVSMSLAALRSDAYTVAAALSDWMPARDPSNGIRRCDRADCARQHYATGLCKPHYERERRAEERADARRATG